VLFTDVNADGETSPLDALIVISQISEGSGLPPDPAPDTPLAPGDYYWDVSGDNNVSPLDVLQVITALNIMAAGEGEETPIRAVPQASGDSIAPAGEGEALGLMVVPDYSLARPVANSALPPGGSAQPDRQTSDSTARPTVAQPDRPADLDSAFEVLGRDSGQLADLALDGVLSDIADDVDEAHEGEMAEDWVLSGLRPRG